MTPNVLPDSTGPSTPYVIPVAANMAPVPLQTNRRPCHRFTPVERVLRHGSKAQLDRVSLPEGFDRRRASPSTGGKCCLLKVRCCGPRSSFPVELHRDDSVDRPVLKALPFAEGLAVLEYRPSVRATYAAAAYTEQAARFAEMALYLQRFRPIVLYRHQMLTSPWPHDSFHSNPVRWHL